MSQHVVNSIDYLPYDLIMKMIEFLFYEYYAPSVEIKDFNVLIDGKRFFDVPIKKEETYEANTEMSKNNNYRTGNLLDCEYFSNH